ALQLPARGGALERVHDAALAALRQAQVLFVRPKARDKAEEEAVQLRLLQRALSIGEAEGDQLVERVVLDGHGRVDAGERVRRAAEHGPKQPLLRSEQAVDGAGGGARLLRESADADLVD